MKTVRDHMKQRQFLTYLITLVFAGLFSCANPTEPGTADYTVKIAGMATNLAGNPLDSIVVTLDSPLKSDTTKGGKFSISFTASSKTDVAVSLNFHDIRKSGLYFDTIITAITYSDKNTTPSIGQFGRISLKGVNAGADSTVTRPSLRAGAIVFAGSTVPNLSIYGAGGTDATTLTFEVRDSVGNPVDTSNQTLVYFRFANTPPDTLTQLSRTSFKTNSSGRVSVILGSGLKAGIASVQAYAAVRRLDDTTRVDTIRSPLVSIPIYGGFPDSLHFSLGAAKVNMSALQSGQADAITGLVGDKAGNPVQPNTVVQFTTTGGVVSPGSSFTQPDGSIATTLLTGNPIPPGGLVQVTAQLTSGSSYSSTSSNSVGGETMVQKNLPLKSRQPTRAELAFQKKRAVVKVAEEATKTSSKKSSGSKSAASEDQSASPNSTTGVFLRTLNIIFSGKTIVASADSNFQIPTAGSASVNFTVADLNGNPLSEGSTIVVSSTGSGSSDVELLGDVNRSIPDTQDKTFTKYRVTLKDKRTVASSSVQNVGVKIDVASPNGNQTLSVNGFLLAGGVADSGKVGKISLVSTTPDTVVVNGGGGVKSKQVQFKAIDVLSQPAKNIPINFEFTKTVNGGEYLSPVSTVTDLNGIATVTFNAGIRSGEVQFIALVKRDSLTSITSDAKKVFIRTGSIASIKFISASTQELAVKNVGGAESATIIFEGRDSLGNAIDFANQTPISFKLQGDTSGVFIVPNPATTDPVTGQVVTTLGSGTKPGVVQVYASAKNDQVKSLPVPFTIASGLPDSAHFTMIATQVNYAVGGTPNASNIGKMVVAVGDTFGNPARVNTSVYFTTNAGFADATGAVDKDGLAQANWHYNVNPRPANGIAFMTARTVNRWGIFVQDTVKVVLSSSPVVSSPDTNFTVAVGSSAQVNFTVSDALLNPLAGTTQITVTGSGLGAPNVELSGDVNVALPDTKSKSFTQFRVFVRDTRVTNLSQSKTLSLTVDVGGPNGTGKFVINGTLLGTGGGTVDSSVIGRIVLQNPNPDSIVVAGVGGTKVKDILYKVYNTFGLPAKNVLLTFSFSKSLGGGEFLSPTTALTDTGGNAKTTITSGNGFGEVRIIASGKKDSLTITSDPKVVYIVIPPSARLASQIAFLGATDNDIFVSGVGGKENSTLTYEVRDSLGFPIDRNRRVFTSFAVQFFPNSFSSGGTAPVVIPSSDSTDDAGRVRTTVASGTQAGVIQIVVNILLPGRPLLVSQPVKISVHAGFADQKHFTVAAAQLNFPGLDRSFVTDNITVQVTDKFSNPVPQGTAVYFNSAHGTITTGGGEAGLTDLNGFVTKTLYSANPFPSPPDTLPGVTRGFSRVYARTIGKDSARVVDSILILWTGAPIITKTGGPASYVIANGGTAGPFTFTVVDRYGHPMSSGTSISVIADACTVSGDANVTMPDTQGSGAGLTSFTVLLGDADPLNSPPAPAPSVMTITVNHPIYGTYKAVIASGTVN